MWVDNFILLVPAIIVFAGASVLMLVGATKNFGLMTSAIVANAFLGVAALVQFFQMGSLYSVGAEGGLFHGMFIADTFSGFVCLIVIVCGMVTNSMSTSYFKTNNFHRLEYNALVLFAVFGMMLMSMAGELITIFVVLEIMSLSIYVLIGMNRTSANATEAVFKYLMLGAFAGAFYVMGAAFIYGVTGTTVISEISKYNAIHATTDMPFMVAGITLILIALFFKVAAFPMHAWTPDVYDGAAMPITGFMATGVKAASFAVMLRLFMVDFLDVQGIWVGPVSVVAILTLFAGNFLAMAQDNVKRMLAASGIVHSGYLLIGIASLSMTGNAAASVLFYLAAYAIGSLGVFAALSYLTGQGEKRITYDDFNGLAKKHPFVAAVIALFMLSFVGFPPTIGFIAKFYLFTSAVEAGNIWLAVFGIISSVVSIYYYLRLIVAMYFKPATEEFDLCECTPCAKYASGIMAFATIWGGIGTMTLVIFPSATTLMESAMLGIQSLF